MAITLPFLIRFSCFLFICLFHSVYAVILCSERNIRRTCFLTLFVKRVDVCQFYLEWTILFSVMDKHLLFSTELRFNSHNNSEKKNVNTKLDCLVFNCSWIMNHARTMLVQCLGWLVRTQSFNSRFYLRPSLINEIRDKIRQLKIILTRILESGRDV